jgi:hypothetical protein
LGERALFVTKMTSGNVEWRELGVWMRLTLFSLFVGDSDRKTKRQRGRLAHDKKSMLQHTLGLEKGTLAHHTNLLIVRPLLCIHFSNACNEVLFQ